MKGNRVPNLVLDPARESLISSSGALLLQEAIRVAGLDPGTGAGAVAVASDASDS